MATRTATALVTPFTSNGAIDEDRLRGAIEYQLAGGVRLLVPCGTTGESATMTEAEDQRVIKLTVDAARGRARVIAGTGSNATSSAIEWSNTARDLGVDAVLVVAPYYNKPTQEGLYTHFRTVAEAVNNLQWSSITCLVAPAATLPPPPRYDWPMKLRTSSPSRRRLRSGSDYGHFARASEPLSRAVRRRRSNFRSSRWARTA